MRIGVISYQIEINVVCHLHSNLHVEWRRRNPENLEKFVFVVDSFPFYSPSSKKFVFFFDICLSHDFHRLNCEIFSWAPAQPSTFCHSFDNFSTRLPTIRCVTSIALEIIVLSKIVRRFLNFSPLPSSWKSDLFGRIFHLNNFPRVERKF